MNNQSQGFAVIFNNREFAEHLNLSERAHTGVDLGTINDLCINWGFEKKQKTIVHNATANKMLETMRAAAAKDYTHSKCFVCVIMTHGADDGFYASDGKVELMDLMEPLKQCQSLACKPKMFFIQADAPCNPVILKSQNPSPDVHLDSDSDEEDDSDTIRIPTETDFFIAYSSVLGIKEMETVSLLLHFLAEVFKETQWQQKDLLSVMTEVNRRVYEVCDDQNPHLLPVFKSTLTQEVFFHQHNNGI